MRSPVARTPLHQHRSPSPVGGASPPVTSVRRPRNEGAAPPPPTSRLIKRVVRTSSADPPRARSASSSSSLATPRASPHPRGVAEAARSTTPTPGPRHSIGERSTSLKALEAQNSTFRAEYTRDQAANKAEIETSKAEILTLKEVNVRQAESIAEHQQQLYRQAEEIAELRRIIAAIDEKMEAGTAMDNEEGNENENPIRRSWVKSPEKNPNPFPHELRTARTEAEIMLGDNVGLSDAEDQDDIAPTMNVRALGNSAPPSMNVAPGKGKKMGGVRATSPLPQQYSNVAPATQWLRDLKTR